MNPEQHDEPRRLEGISELAAVGDFIRMHGLRISLWAAAALAVGIGASGYRGCARHHDAEATRLFSSARTIQDLETVVEKYPSADAAPLALLRLAKAYYDVGRYDLALQKYSDFIDRFGAHDLVKAAELGRIHCREALGQFREAERDFRAFAAANADNYLTPQAVFGRARCLEQMDLYNEARIVYEDFIATRPDSGWMPRAKQALETLQEKIESTQPEASAPSAGDDTP